MVVCSMFIKGIAIAQFATLAGGGEGSGPGGTVSFSVGQLVVESTEDSEGSISPGVQQTYESNVVFINEVSLNTVKVFPNPTTHFIELSFDTPFNGSLVVYDLNARVVLEQRVNESTKVIDAQSWSAGTYMIQLFDEVGTFSIHKIIKNN